jgi:hypothetical protein
MVIISLDTMQKRCQDAFCISIIAGHEKRFLDTIFKVLNELPLDLWLKLTSSKTQENIVVMMASVALLYQLSGNIVNPISGT